ncbi:MAG: transglutaminase domain-containing protein [Clostridia bacterium]|nr:transglutaminase domain-containing protein [Clostridia bacterium]
MEEIRDEGRLARLLLAAQENRQGHCACVLSASFALRHSDAQLRAMADMMLCMTQARALQVRRMRDGSARLGVTMTLREGLRLADARAAGREDMLPPRERETLRAALSICWENAAGETQTARFRRLFDWVAEHVVYENLAPGQKEYGRLVSASGALLCGRANCQGFADAYRLLCALDGLKAGYLCGWSGKGTHLLNRIFADGRWYAADASRASRLLRQGSGTDAAFLLDTDGCKGLGVSLPEWMKMEVSE